MFIEVNPVRNSSGALNPAGINLKCNPAAAAGPEGLWPGGPPAQALPKRGFCPGGRASRFRVATTGPEEAAGHYF